MPWWSGTIRRLLPDMVFVFGSNPNGWHSKGAALFAKEHCGAIYRQPRGLQGQSYALVTKNLKKGTTERLVDGSTITYDKIGFRSVSKKQIEYNIRELYQCCLENPQLRFIICYRNDGYNLNGYTPHDMWEMFHCMEVPNNVYFHESFKPMVGLPYTFKV